MLHPCQMGKMVEISPTQEKSFHFRFSIQLANITKKHITPYLTGGDMTDPDVLSFHIIHLLCRTVKSTICSI